MKNIFINIDDNVGKSIFTRQDNNNAEIYKIYFVSNEGRVNLDGKSVKLGYNFAGTDQGDVLNLDITDSENGEVTLPITNKLTRKDGIFYCQFRIYGANGYLENLVKFTLTVEKTVFSEITEGIEDIKGLTYVENILEETKELSNSLKSSISIGSILNDSLEKNIIDGDNLKDSLENSIKNAEERKFDLDTRLEQSNLTITEVNQKIEKLEQNISEADITNVTLRETTKESKLVKIDAMEKKSQLESSITKAKEFIDGLDGSQNIPSIRMELTELQNGLKSNQSLEYSGSSITANDTIEGRTEGMKVKGRTLINLAKSYRHICVKGVKARFRLIYPTIKPGTYTVIINASELTEEELTMFDEIKSTTYPYILKNGLNIRKIEVKEEGETYDVIVDSSNEDNSQFVLESLMILKGDWIDKKLPEYFEGIKSFGEEEQVGDKYKLSILSTGKNLAKLDLKNPNIIPFGDGFRLDCHQLHTLKQDIFNMKGKYKEYTQYTISYLGKLLDNYNKNNYRLAIYYTDGTCSIGVIHGNGYSEATINSSKWKTIEMITGYYSSPNGIFIVKDLMLEEGTRSAHYEEYKEDKKDILIKEPLREGDYLYENNGQVNVFRPTKQYTFTGEERMELSDSQPQSGNYLRIWIRANEMENLKEYTGVNIICNNLPSEYINNLEEKEGIYVSNGIDIQISKSKLSNPTIEGFKTWLKANPTTIVYQLVTPVIEIVENCVDIDLDTHQEKTYFNILNSLPGTLDFKVPSNLGSSLQNLAKEVNNIWDVINNLLVPSIVKANGNLAMLKLNNN